jgi:sarcosine oxidase / L-pipecolate oxidase
MLIGESVYIERAYQNDVSIGAPVERCQTSEALRAHFPPAANVSLEGFAGYVGHDGGWVESGRAVALLLDEIKRLGARVVADCRVSRLMKMDGTTRGVVCVDSRTFMADKIVLAAGSWTAGTFEDQLDLGLEMKCLATG